MTFSDGPCFGAVAIYFQSFITPGHPLIFEA